MGEHLDTMPRQLMALLQLGQRERLDNANTPWICASCHACMVRCPRGIDIPKVMEAMRQVQLRDNVDKVDLNKLTPEQLAQMPQIALVSGFRKMTS
jgi:heterodisulfide reductase subunit C